MIIDFHTHTFPPEIAGTAIPMLAKKGNIKNYTNGTKDDLSASMKKAGIDYSVILPIATKPTQSEKLICLAAETNQTTASTGFISFGSVHPENENFKELLKEAKSLGIKGIKLHPHYQNITQKDYPTLCKIVDEIENLEMITIFHAGFDVGFETDCFCRPKDFFNLYRDVKPTKLVLAHMGGWRLWDEVYEKLCSLPIYFDTSFALGDYVPLNKDIAKNCSRLSEREFVRIIRKHGADKILFGSDSPWGDQNEALKRLEQCNFSENELLQIKGENAKKLLRIN